MSATNTQNLTLQTFTKKLCKMNSNLTKLFVWYCVTHDILLSNFIFGIFTKSCLRVPILIQDGQKLTETSREDQHTSDITPGMVFIIEKERAACEMHAESENTADN